MKIISVGKKETEKEYVVTCNDCGTHFSFLASEGKTWKSGNAPNEYDVVVNCPVCHKEKHVAA